MNTFAFNYWIEAARDQLESSRRYTFASVRAPLLRTARAFLRLALAEANKLRDRARVRLCLRILNWLRADLIRFAA